MGVMSKKKATSNDRSKDRHRPRRMVALDPDLYDRLKALADRNGRPVSWEIRLVLTKHVQENEPPVEE
jgi:predicted DNA-binding protein